MTGRYQTSAGSGTTALRTTGAVNQIIQIYGDASHNGPFDHRSYLVIKFQANPYVDTRSDILALAGVSTLEPFEYSVAISPTALDITAGTGGATLTLVDHTAAPITVGGKSFSYEIQDGGTASAEDILRTWDYSIAQTGTYQGTDTFNLPEFIAQSGATYETRRGIVETEGDTFYGCYVSRSGNDHPDFTRFQSDDATYYTPTVTANWTGTNLPDDVGGDTRLQIENLTAVNASAWQATTAYSRGDIVLRTTGAGAENVAGLFFRCTTAGTTGGTEPTWVTTTPGTSTTTDGTVVWTVYNIMYYNQDPASTGASASYIDGEEFASGETARITFAHVNGATSFELGRTTAAVSVSGFSFDGSLFVSADSVYASNGLYGGSYETTFSPDYTNDYIVLDTNTDYTIISMYAYYCYLLTSSQGMWDFWGAITAIDVGNYRNNDSSVKPVYLDESGGFVKQTDSARFFNESGTRPAIDPTTGGNGIEVNWRNPVYVQNVGGSALLTDERTQLFAIPTTSGATAAEVFTKSLEANLVE